MYIQVCINSRHFDFDYERNIFQQSQRSDAITQCRRLQHLNLPRGLHCRCSLIYWQGHWNWPQWRPGSRGVTSTRPRSASMPQREPQRRNSCMPRSYEVNTTCYKGNETQRETERKTKRERHRKRGKSNERLVCAMVGQTVRMCITNEMTKCAAYFLAVLKIKYEQY